jgi:hypothetical protein
MEKWNDGMMEWASLLLTLSGLATLTGWGEVSAEY